MSDRNSHSFRTALALAALIAVALMAGVIRVILSYAPDAEEPEAIRQEETPIPVMAVVSPPKDPPKDREKWFRENVTQMFSQFRYDYARDSMLRELDRELQEAREKLDKYESEISSHVEEKEALTALVDAVLSFMEGLYVTAD